LPVIVRLLPQTTGGWNRQTLFNTHSTCTAH